MARLQKSSDWVIAAAMFGALGCTEDDSHLGGHAGEAGTSAASGGQLAEGGSATGGKGDSSATGGKGGSSATGGKGGSSATGGKGGSSAMGGSATGGNDAQGGAETGGRSGGASGGPSAGASGAGSCVPFKNPVCNSDADCSADEYCEKACAPSACGCSGGQLGCTADCRNLCQPLSTECTAAEPIFSEQLSDEHCTTLVRLSGDGSQVLGYAVNCAAAQPTSEEDALNVLLPMSSINWSGATPVGKPESTGVYAFKNAWAGALYTGFISAATRRLLAITQAPMDALGTVRVPTAWRDAAELGSTCAADRALPVVVFAIDGTDFFPAVPSATLLKTGLVDALRAKFGSAGPVAITNVDPQQTELLAFVSAP